jgi:hypothetical protein
MLKIERWLSIRYLHAARRRNIIYFIDAKTESAAGISTRDVLRTSPVEVGQ